MTNKRYHWLKLDENFFEDDTVKYIEEQNNGQEYIIFYLKLALKSLKDDGKLIRYVGNTLIPYDAKALSDLTNTPVDTVSQAVQLFNQIGLIEMTELNEIFLTQVQEMTGSETASTRRSRKSRARQKALEQQSRSNLLQCNIDATKCNTEKEIEIDKELEQEREGESSVASSEDDTTPAERIPYKKIIQHLNDKADKNFNFQAKSNRELIRTRWNEGFRENDFITVIDKMVAEWKGSEKMNQYLRPRTLFSGKFDNYLNKPTKPVEESIEDKFERNLREYQEEVGNNDALPF